MKKSKQIFAIILTLLLLTVLSACGKTEEPVEVNPADPLYGSWRTTFSLTGNAEETTESWLGHGIDMADYLPPLGITVTLTMNRSGVWSSNISEADYVAADLQVRNALAVALTDLVALRLRAAGYGVDVAALTQQAIADPEETIEGTVTVTTEIDSDLSAGREQAAALIEQTVGMTPEIYVGSLGLQFLPSLEELQAKLNGSGSFTADGTTLTLSKADGSFSSYGYIVSDGTLVFTNDTAGNSTPTLFTLSVRG